MLDFPFSSDWSLAKTIAAASGLSQLFNVFSSKLQQQVGYIYIRCLAISCEQDHSSVTLHPQLESRYNNTLSGSTSDLQKPSKNELLSAKPIISWVSRSPQIDDISHAISDSFIWQIDLHLLYVYTYVPPRSAPFPILPRCYFSSFPQVRTSYVRHFAAVRPRTDRRRSFHDRLLFISHRARRPGS